ncbi:hypothetical protein RHGRI_035849 [Rhododendron griersonianum]|uniref:Uncharacterized protein n=1 Tax=Rhododendron griersonianum TaxID=479676 RepID=A0AAV6HL71_9ERIC|nr:hypothetical protein RHGRI_035849 [Rhododendron griersonianum]
MSEPNVVSWIALVSGNARVGRESEAKEVLEDKENKGIELNVDNLSGFGPIASHHTSVCTQGTRIEESAWFPTVEGVRQMSKLWKDITNIGGGNANMATNIVLGDGRNSSLLEIPNNNNNNDRDNNNNSNDHNTEDNTAAGVARNNTTRAMNSAASTLRSCPIHSGLTQKHQGGSRAKMTREDTLSELNVGFGS